jgi:hypothetical protein
MPLPLELREWVGGWVQKNGAGTGEGKAKITRERGTGGSEAFYLSLLINSPFELVSRFLVR